ncbi:MAG: hypothetical protein JWR42_51 [Marmoricola sp.]|nr:hypothetical protein [Marmoricola sp.]
MDRQTVRPPEGSPAQPYVRLSPLGQTYVATVAVVAGIAMLAESELWYVALVVLTLPLSLLALWVALYSSLAVGLLVGAEASRPTWPVVLVWVLVWGTTAWINARMTEKILRRGWSALRVGPPAPVTPEDEQW